jgi:hypothetical protein
MKHLKPTELYSFRNKKSMLKSEEAIGGVFLDDMFGGDGNHASGGKPLLLDDDRYADAPGLFDLEGG